jgi:hypothetical protein
MKTIKLNESQLRKMIRKQLDEAGWGEPGPSPMKRDLAPRGAGEVGAGTASPPVRGSVVKPGRGAGPHDPEALRNLAIAIIKDRFGDDAVLESDEEDEKDVEAEDED